MFRKRSPLARIVAHPGAESICTGMTPFPSRRAIQALGNPRPGYTQECQPVTNPKWLRHMVTDASGFVRADGTPIRITGLRPAVESIQRVAARVKREDPGLYSVIGTAGMTCARLIRGSRTAISVHSFGCAIDLTIDGVLQPLGSAGVQEGMLRLYRFMRDEGWYWGARFSRNDPMHWEVSAETWAQWVKEGRI